MASSSSIEWTEKTWNPTTGCTKLSAGCKNCYAITMSNRLHAMGTPGYENNFQLTMHSSRLNQPRLIRKPSVFFVNSMSDLFHRDVAESFLDQVFDTIRATPHHTYQVLTKRAERLPGYFAHRAVPHNVWLGVSVEDTKHGLARIEELRKVDAATRFLSVEPLLEDLGSMNLEGIHWVIGGGESGHGARPMEASWIRGVRDQCAAQGVPFFFKQWGAYGADGIKRHKKGNGNVLDGKTHLDYPTIGFAQAA